MFKIKSRLFSGALAFAVALSTMTMPYSAAENGEKTVVIFHTNDMHGSLQGSDSVIGVAKAAALKKQDEDKAILVDAGDAAQGIALASLSKGEDVIELMNTAGYDVMAAGNHEFDYGLEQLSKLVDMAKFPIISANTYYNGKPLFETDSSDGASVIIEKNGVKVGFFALTTSNTATSTNPKNISGVEFKDEVETAKQQVESLDQKGADVIIAITHMGIIEEESDCTSHELAEAMAGTELDAVIDGHSHSVENTKVGDIVIAQTGTAFAGLGKMEITLDENGNAEINETLLTPEDTKDVVPDADTEAELESITEKQGAMLSEVIGETTGTLWGGSINQIAESRVGETNFGSLISDAIAESVKELLPDEYKSYPVVAVENGGGFRSGVPNGKMTRGHIVNALPFANTVMYKVVSPAVLYSVLEASVSTVNSQNAETGFMDAAYSGSFLQIGGMRFEYDPNAEQGAKVKAVYLDSQSTPLDRNDNDTKIILGSNDYVIGLSVLGDIPLSGEGVGLEQAVEEHIAALTENGTKPLSLPVTSGRIKTVGSYQPKNYTAHIRVQNADGTPAAQGTNTSVYVDNVKTEGTIDADGILNIEVSDGPHAVKLYPEQAEVYVNNYSGAGVIESYGAWNAGYPKLALAENIGEETTAAAETVTETASETTTEAAPEATTASDSGRRSGGGRGPSKQNNTAVTTVAESDTEETTSEKTAEKPEPISISISVGSNKLMIGDRSYDMDAEPYIQQSSDSVLIPLRFVVAALTEGGIDDADNSSAIEWLPDKKTAVIYSGESIVTFTADSNIMTVGDMALEMDNGVRAEIRNDRMYIPFRALGKALGVDAEWDADTRTASFEHIYRIINSRLY